MKLILIAAQSLDGFISKHREGGSGFTSLEDKRHFKTALEGFDCSVMGSRTYDASRALIIARPSARLRLVLTRSPQRYTSDGLPGALEFTNCGPEGVVNGLRGRGKKNCAILGGSQIHSLFLVAGFVDEIWLTIEPMLFGQGTPFLKEPADLKLKLMSTEALSMDTLLLRYEVPTKPPTNNSPRP